MDNNHKAFWETRSSNYNQLEWAKRQDYLKRFVACGDFRPTDVVLDVGTGTGIVAHAVAPLVSKVVGIDISPAMLRQALQHHNHNGEFVISDLRDILFPDDTFTKVTARMVFHHVLEGTVDAMRECHRVLTPGGRMIFSEGVPPDPALRDWYTRMFALKEKRLTFLEEGMVALMRAGGFSEIVSHTHISRQVSIRNWLRNSGLPRARQDAIWQMHLELDGAGRRYYNLQFRGDDILLDMKFIILVGTKSL